VKLVSLAASKGSAVAARFPSAATTSISGSTTASAVCAAAPGVLEARQTAETARAQAAR
jgi:hypothetical protein